MHNGFSPSRRAWNRVMTVLVWAAALLVMALAAGIIGMVLVRGVPHIRWNFLTTTASVLKGTDGILPAILNTLYVILLTLPAGPRLPASPGAWAGALALALVSTVLGLSALDQPAEKLCFRAEQAEEIMKPDSTSDVEKNLRVSPKNWNS
jgi:hypothetical protein